MSGITDPIADMLTRIRNALMAGHKAVTIPSSNVKLAIAKILKDEGFIENYELLKGPTPQRVLKVYLKYTEEKKPVLTGLKRVSKPGCRVYTKKSEIPRVYGGMGTAIMSTPLGIVTGHEAWRKSVGGEVLCYVW